jgi:hypothetical protein
MEERRVVRQDTCGRWRETWGGEGEGSRRSGCARGRLDIALFVAGVGMSALLLWAASEGGGAQSHVVPPRGAYRGARERTPHLLLEACSGRSTHRLATERSAGVRGQGGTTALGAGAGYFTHTALLRTTTLAPDSRPHAGRSEYSVCIHCPTRTRRLIKGPRGKKTVAYTLF